MVAWTPIPKEISRQILRDARPPFPPSIAYLSVSLDCDENTPVSIAGYAALFGWSQGKVRRFLERIGVRIRYPEDTGRLQNQRGEIVIQIPEGSRRDNGEIVLLNFNSLQDETERPRRDSGEKAERSRHATKDTDTETDTKRKNLSPDALRLSGLLGDLIAGNNPKTAQLQAGKRERTISQWAKDMDRMIRLDGRSPEEVTSVIEWCQADSFWRCNILSGGKLREKYDTLLLQMQREGEKSAHGGSVVPFASGRRIY